MSPRTDALRYHSKGRPGKIEVVPTKPTHTQRDLSLAYTPGVAEPCREIARSAEESYRYTARGNLVAVVTDGSAVLGLGDIGPEASKPVMEGKGVLFKRFADIDVFDLELDADGAEDVIRFCQMLEPTVGGINLEDIRAPRSFRVERELRDMLDIPVFHDDQHGTAIISGAALVNALHLVDKSIEDVRIVFSGAGGAAVATAEHYLRLGARRENIVMADSVGVVYEGREQMDPFKAQFARDTDLRTLAEAMEEADVFVGLSVGDIVDREMVASMSERPVVFAMANPVPEIMPEDVKAAAPDAIVATGRSDYPNQVNNVLGFPFIFRGALDVRARAINDEMMMAATRALAKLAREDVPEAVAAAYGGERLHFGPEYLIPKPFDTRVLLSVAPAVARAGMETGVARRDVDLEEYRAELEARLGPGREFMRRIINQAGRAPKRIVLPEGECERVVRSTTVIRDEGIGTPVLVGRSEKIREVAEREEVDLRGVEIQDPESAETRERRERYAERFWRSRHRKGITRAEARSRMRDPMYFGAMMVAAGDGDTLLTGADQYYPDALRPSLQAIGPEQETPRVAGLYLMVFADELYVIADATVNPDPTAEELSEIAIVCAEFAVRFGVEPRVAMLSFSNFGSTRHPAATKVREAVSLVKERRPDLTVDGEMQVDTALSTDALREIYPFADLDEPANVLVFPNLDAANSAYKLLAQLGGAEAIGPVLLGMAEPVHVLQRGASAAEIAHLAAISVVDAQAREKGGLDDGELIAE